MAHLIDCFAQVAACSRVWCAVGGLSVEGAWESELIVDECAVAMSLGELNGLPTELVKIMCLRISLLHLLLAAPPTPIDSHLASNCGLGELEHLHRSSVDGG